MNMKKCLILSSSNILNSKGKECDCECALAASPQLSRNTLIIGLSATSEENWGPLRQSVSTTAAHDAAAAAIRQLFWRSADLGAAYLWSGGFINPGWGGSRMEVCLIYPPWGPTEDASSLKFCSVSTLCWISRCSHSLRSTWGFFSSSGLLPLSHGPTQTDVRPLGLLVGSCKPPVCTGLHSYGGPTVMAVQAPYRCKCWQADTL